MGNIVSHTFETMKETALLHQLDAIDWKIMKILQEDGRLSNAELAERVSLSASPCWKRLKRLETSGVIRGYQAILDRRALGMGVVAFVSISLENHTEKTCRAFEAAVAAMPEVLACCTSWRATSTPIPNSCATGCAPCPASRNCSARCRCTK